MSEPYAPLHETLERLDALLRERGVHRSEVFDVAELSAKTAIPVEDVHALLDGKALPEDEVEARVCGRINLLYKRLVEDTGKRPVDVVKDVAANLKVSEVWARMLIKGDKLPNVPHLKVLAEYFRVPVAFFTDSAPAALDRELRPIVDRLEEPDPLASLMRQFDIKGISARTDGRPLSPGERARIAAILQIVLSEEEPRQ